MRDHVPLLLYIWAASTPFLFRIIPGRDAALACMVLGWAFLPVAPYPPSVVIDGPEDSGIHALAVPTPQLINKATAIGLGCVAGLILFDRRTFGRLRFDRLDLPMVAWCLAPMASTISNGLPLSEGLSQVRYLSLAWGGPYLMGRAYLVDEESRRRFAVALAAGGLAYLPLCLLEIVEGPSAYRIAYGAHPYEFEGAARFIGDRPLGFQEHGNQLGMWMASSAVAATWLWASGSAKKPGGIRGGVLAAILIGITLLCQSHASILLMAVALFPLLFARFFRGRAAPWRAVAAALSGLAILIVFLLAARRGFNLGALRVDATQFFQGINKSSLTWRLARSEQFLPVAMQQPWLGSGRADWRPEGLPFVNPVNLSLWLLALGMYGVVGLGVLVVVWAWPVDRTFRSRHPPFLGSGGGATGAMIAVVAINFLDGFSNSTMILPVVAALGGLGRPAPQRPDLD